jgi:transcriptional regulator with XRE-family HTH domain
MHAYSYTFRRHRAQGRQLLRAWNMRRAWTMSGESGIYCDGMPQPLEVRRANFAAWVARVLLHARTARGMTVTQIAKTASIGSQTIYRWRNGDWRGEGPKPDQLVAFCDALDIDPVEAFKILWPGKAAEMARPEPLTITDPDMLVLARKLNDTSVSAQEKYLIQETLAQLAARADQRATRPGRVVKRIPKTS